MSKTTAARTALRTLAASALIVLVTGVGAGTSRADEPAGTTTASYGSGTGNEDGSGTTTGDTTGTGTTGGTTGTTGPTDNNPWDNNPWD